MENDEPKPEAQVDVACNEIEVEMCIPESVMISIARAASVSNVNGDFAFCEDVRNAIGMQLLRYIKKVTREY